MNTLKDTLEADKLAYQSELKDLFKDFEQEEEQNEKSDTSKKDVSEEDNISKSSTPSIKTKIYKVGGVRCTLKGKKYLSVDKNKLIAYIDDDGDVNLVNNEEKEDDDLDKLEKEFDKEVKPKKQNNINSFWTKSF